MLTHWRAASVEGPTDARYAGAMKLLILTYGTEGDTRPLAALGHALMQAGHAVAARMSAARLGESMRREDGLIQGARWVEQCAGR